MKWKTTWKVERPAKKSKYITRAHQRHKYKTLHHLIPTTLGYSVHNTKQLKWNKPANSESTMMVLGSLRLRWWHARALYMPHDDSLPHNLGNGPWPFWDPQSNTSADIFGERGHIQTIYPRQSMATVILNTFCAYFGLKITLDRIPAIDAIGVGNVWGMVPFIQAVGPTDLLDERIQILGPPFGRTMYHCWYRTTVAATALVVQTSNGEYRGRHKHKGGGMRKSCSSKW